ncbi:protein phosphatase 2C domain-containing protein [Devosia sp. A16]|uniref:protein phosphatase 2C domain-containing protein n=1 Tax=Devosia sp. A16 TaxID=1736675 RepID=UPI000A7D23D5|nr:protein phosphatase 2C domain-containing protein [Devosia sp. A16]
MQDFVWSGRADPCLAGPRIHAAGQVAIGLCGGNARMGASKNEDAALVWAGKDWVFAVILDAHASSESADAVLELFETGKAELLALIERPEPSLLDVQGAVTRLLLGGVDRLARVRGETACLVCFQRGGYLMWLSIGDNQLYLLHPELRRLGQFTLTVRNYFEWVGERSSLALEVPCFSTGIRQLRQGINTIAMVTDGLLEVGDRPFEDPARLSRELLSPVGLSGSIAAMLAEVHRLGGADSSTVIAWQVDNPVPGLMPSG